MKKKKRKRREKITTFEWIPSRVSHNAPLFLLFTNSRALMLDFKIVNNGGACTYKCVGRPPACVEGFSCIENEEVAASVKFRVALSSWQIRTGYFLTSVALGFSVVCKSRCSGTPAWWHCIITSAAYYAAKNLPKERTATSFLKKWFPPQSAFVSHSRNVWGWNFMVAQ